MYAVAIPLGIHSATHKYTWRDNILAFLAFLGMSLPGFLLALMLMVMAFNLFGLPLFGLFSRPFRDAPWSLATFGDLWEHLWIPVGVVAIDGTAGLMRVLRRTLL